MRKELLLWVSLSGQPNDDSAIQLSKIMFPRVSEGIESEINILRKELRRMFIMKIKTIAKALACATALSVAVSSSAFAAPTMTASRAGSNVTVDYSGISGQMTLLAFDITAAYEALTGGTGAEDTPYVDQEIVYVAQEDAGSSKTFTVKDGWAPAEGESKYLLVKVGGTDIDTPAAQVVAFEYQETPDVTYGDVDGIGGVTATDVGIIISNILGKDSSLAEGTPGFIAADVDGIGGLTAADVGLIISKILGKIDTFPVEAAAAASIEEPEEVVAPEDNAEVVEPEEATEPEEETPAEDAEEVKSEEVTEEVEESEEAAEETSEEETEEETEAEVEAEVEAAE